MCLVPRSTACHSYGVNKEHSLFSHVWSLPVGSCLLGSCAWDPWDGWTLGPRPIGCPVTLCLYKTWECLHFKRPIILKSLHCFLPPNTLQPRRVGLETPLEENKAYGRGPGSVTFPQLDTHTPSIPQAVNLPRVRPPVTPPTPSPGSHSSG